MWEKSKEHHPDNHGSYWWKIKTNGEPIWIRYYFLEDVKLYSIFYPTGDPDLPMDYGPEIMLTRAQFEHYLNNPEIILMESML